MDLLLAEQVMTLGTPELCFSSDVRPEWVEIEVLSWLELEQTNFLAKANTQVAHTSLELSHIY